MSQGPPRLLSRCTCIIYNLGLLGLRNRDTEKVVAIKMHGESRHPISAFSTHLTFFLFSRSLHEPPSRSCGNLYRRLRAPAPCAAYHDCQTLPYRPTGVHSESVEREIKGIYRAPPMRELSPNPAVKRIEHGAALVCASPRQLLAKSLREGAGARVLCLEGGPGELAQLRGLRHLSGFR